MGSIPGYPDGLRLEAQAIRVDVTPTLVADLAWRFVDASGHEHRWHGADDMAATTPTLRFVVDIPGGDDYPDRGHWECVECGATVPEPRLVANRIRRYQRVGWEYAANGQPIDKAEFDRLRAMIEASR